jgi:hypothetical protein
MKNYKIEFSEEKYNMDFVLKCPVCNFNYTHIEKIIELEGDEYNQKSVRLEMSCESDHCWNITLGGHKGNIFTHLEIKKNMKEQIEKQNTILKARQLLDSLINPYSETEEQHEVEKVQKSLIRLSELVSEN